MDVVKKPPCSPCQENAVLHVGDAICHRIQKSGGRVDCHALVHAVREKKMTLTQYVDELDKRATSKEKNFVSELRQLYD